MFKSGLQLLKKMQKPDSGNPPVTNVTRLTVENLSFAKRNGRLILINTIVKQTLVKEKS